MKIEKVAFLVNEDRDTWEGLRSTLGLLVENMWAVVFYIDCNVELPKGKTPEEFEEYLEMLADLEGELYTNNQALADKWEGIEYMALEEMPAKIKEYELVVPF